MKSIRIVKTIIKRFHVKIQQVFLLFLDFFEVFIEAYPRWTVSWSYTKSCKQVNVLPTGTSLIGRTTRHTELSDWSTWQPLKERQCRSVIYLENRQILNKSARALLKREFVLFVYKSLFMFENKNFVKSWFCANFTNFQVLNVEFEAETEVIWRHFWQISPVVAMKYILRETLLTEQNIIDQRKDVWDRPLLRCF